MLEKILDEIEEATRQEDAPIYCGSMEVDGYIRMSRVKDIIISRMNDGKDTNVHTNDGWIPVEERPPEEDGFYLVSLSIDTDIDEMKVQKAWFSEKSRLFPSYGKAVIAWQPLPEPYHQEKRKKKETDRKKESEET